MSLLPVERELLIAFLAFLYGVVCLWTLNRSKCLQPLNHLPNIKLCHVKTGDLLLFSTSSLKHDAMKFILGSAYIHVGIAFVDRAGQHFVFEVCANGRGNQMNWLYKRLTLGNERCIIRPINKTLNAEKFERVVFRLFGKPYSYEVMAPVLTTWIKHMLLPVQQREGIDRARVCAELVADVYEMMGVFDFRLCSQSSSTLTPQDFSYKHENLPLISGYSFGEEYILV